MLLSGAACYQRNQSSVQRSPETKLRVRGGAEPSDTNKTPATGDGTGDNVAISCVTHIFSICSIPPCTRISRVSHFAFYLYLNKKITRLIIVIKDQQFSNENNIVLCYKW